MLFCERLRLRRCDGDFRVPGAHYSKWLPEDKVRAFSHYGEEGVPLLVVEHEISSLVPDLPDDQMADLMFQLDRDAFDAEAEAKLAGRELAEEDSNALELLGSSEWAIF